MRTLCDVCESAAAILFCAADEAALCQSCDDQVHLCNKLASRHVRVKLADPSGVGSCDICENAPGEVRTGKTQTTNVAPGDRVQNHGVSFIPTPDHNNHEHGKMETKMIDLNARPNRINGHASNSQVQSLDTCNGYCS